MTPQFLTCQVDLFEDDRKVTPSAGCSFLYVCFSMVGTYCNWGLTVHNKQCQPLGHNNRPLWNPENYTLALSNIIRFSTAPVSKVKVTFSQEEITFVQDQKRELT